MNSGIIASRYAKAFFEYTELHKLSDRVCPQVSSLLSLMKRLPKLRLALSDPKTVSKSEKLELLRSAIQGDPQEIVKFYVLMYDAGRSEYFRMALLDYLGLYRESRGIMMVQVTTAVPDSTLADMVKETVAKDWGKTASVNLKVDPSIIGGFVFESWGYRYDASVRTRLERIRKQMAKKSERMV